MATRPVGFAAGKNSQHRRQTPPMSQYLTWYVPLDGEVEAAVLHDEVEAVVEAGPTPHVLPRTGGQGPAKQRGLNKGTMSTKCFNIVSDLKAVP